MLENLKDDIMQYDEFIESFNAMETEDIELAYDLAKQSFILANRWNEIMLNSAKYSDLTDYGKTTFEKWAYHKYRILMVAHEFCRVTWRQGKEELRNTFLNEE